MIHHSDRGVQYASGDYTDRLQARDIAISMSRVANPYDNAKAESFMKTLKAEEVNGKAYGTFDQARRDIGAFIETVYNTERLHSALGYKPPVRRRTVSRSAQEIWRAIALYGPKVPKVSARQIRFPGRRGSLEASTRGRPDRAITNAAFRPASRRSTKIAIAQPAMTIAMVATPRQ